MNHPLTCREATKLLLEGEERDIQPTERALLKVHVEICRACQRFIAQLDFMRHATGAWRKHGETDADDPNR